MEYGIQDTIMNPQMLCEQLSAYNYILEERKKGMNKTAACSYTLALADS
jgi:hypothetical protein